MVMLILQKAFYFTSLVRKDRRLCCVTLSPLPYLGSTLVESGWHLDRSAVLESVPSRNLWVVERDVVEKEQAGSKRRRRYPCESEGNDGLCHVLPTVWRAGTKSLGPFSPVSAVRTSIVGDFLGAVAGNCRRHDGDDVCSRHWTRYKRSDSPHARL